MTLIKHTDMTEGEIFNKWLHSRLVVQNKNVLSAELGPTGCQPKGSKVLMADGSWKNIEDIKIGDLVLSPQKDGSHVYSKVKNLTSWFCSDNYDVLYKNKKGKKLYSCSYNHLIPVHNKVNERITLNGKRVSKKRYWRFKNYSAEDFSKMSSEMKSHQNISFTSFKIDKYKGIKNCKIEPYTLGVHLGDGMFRSVTTVKKNKNYDEQERSDKKLFHTSKVRAISITSNDYEILEEVSKHYPIINISHKKGTNAKSYSFSLNGKLSEELSELGLEGKNSGNKFIPKEALLSDSEYRIKLLAGLIDTDGYYKRGGYSFTLKSKQLIKDIRDLVYSLGGRCGMIHKYKGRIKSIGFEGEYYHLSFYLKDLNIPLKLNRKKKEISSIYLDSNRTGINCIKNNKKNKVYGFELDSDSQWYITDNWMVTHNSGKSYRDLRKAELWYKYHFKEDFPVENICFGVPAIMKRLSDGNLRKAEIIIGEEAGVNLGSRSWQSNVSKMFNYVLQSFRSMNIGVFFNLPYLSMLDSQARHLLHYYAESAGVDQQTGINKCKPFFVQVAQSSGKIYRHYPKVKSNGRLLKVKRFKYSMPSQYLVDAYEDKKAAYLKQLIKGYSDKVNGKKETPEPSELAKKCHYMSTQLGKTQRQIADEVGKAQQTVHSHIKKVRMWLKEGQKSEDKGSVSA